MNELIKATNGTITSLELLKQINLFRADIEGKAELAHSDLLKVIRDEFEEEIGAGDFSCGSYLDKQSQSRPMFVLTLDQAKQVLVRESKAVRKAVIAYIKALEAMIKPQTPQTYIEALEALVVAEKEKERLTLENKEMKPLADYATKMLKSKDSILVRELAKIFYEHGVFMDGEKKLYKWLRDNKYLMPNNEPYQNHMKRFEVQKRVVDTPFGERDVFTTKVTPQGQLYFYNVLLKQRG